MFSLYKEIYNIETSIRPQREKINIEALHEKIQRLSSNTDYINLRLEILEEDKKTIREDHIKQKYKRIVIAEACEAANIEYNHKDETIIPISKQINSSLIKLECRIWFSSTNFIDVMVTLDTGCFTSMISYSMLPKQYLIKLNQEIQTRSVENNILKIEYKNRNKIGTIQRFLKKIYYSI